MATMGTIYVLINPAIPGLVKVGKTTRSVDARAKELSSATGVPSEFFLIYEQQFVDVDAAERQIHAVLETKGFRHATNREFFNANPTDIIKLINGTSGKSGEIINKYSSTYDDPDISSQIDEDDEFGGLKEIEDSIKIKNFPWYEIWIEAESYYFGTDGYIKDYTDAFDAYLKAIKMGCPLAFQRIGDMFLSGEGMSRTDKKKALEYYKQGVKNGDYYCYLKMGILYCEDKNFENTKKCFDYFIEKHSCNDMLIEYINDLGSDLRHFIFDTYETFSFTNEHKNFIRNHKQEILEEIENGIDYCKTVENSGAYLLSLRDLQKYISTL